MSTNTYGVPVTASVVATLQIPYFILQVLQDSPGPTCYKGVAVTLAAC